MVTICCQYAIHADRLPVLAAHGHVVLGRLNSQPSRIMQFWYPAVCRLLAKVAKFELYVLAVVGMATPVGTMPSA